MTSDSSFTPYHKKLFVFLSVASFFEGYDFFALTQILPQIKNAYALSKLEAGALVTFINAGTVVAYLLVRSADRVGRKTVLTWTIAGYTICTFLTGLSPNVYLFAIAQFLARIFLIGEWATAQVMAAEEYPAARRGMVIGVINACAALGSIICAGVVPLLLRTEYGWRSVYFVGIIPLIILAFARRGLKETKRFEAHKASGAAERKRSLLAIMKGPHRRRVLQLAFIWFLTYVCTHNAITFWKEFALAERGWSDDDVGLAITLGALVSMPFVFLAGRLLDGIGRRRGAVIIFGLGAAGVVGCYTLEGFWPLTAVLTLGIFGASAVPPVLNAFSTELFPTESRADAFAWANNLLGRIGYVLSPIAVGAAAEEVGWGPAVGSTAIFEVMALVLILFWLPETNRKELEETAVA